MLPNTSEGLAVVRSHDSHADVVAFHQLIGLLMRDGLLKRDTASKRHLATVD
jgi:hypothetical protein